MTEPSPPPSAPTPPSQVPSPFDRPPSMPRARSEGPGVGKPLLIGCGVLLVLVLISGVLFVANQNRIVAWLFEVMESELAPSIPADLPPEVRERYDVAFEGAIAAFRSGDYDPFAMQGLSQVMREVAEKGQRGTVTQEDVERLTSALERVAGSGGGGDGESPDAPVEESWRGSGPGMGGGGPGKILPAPSRSA